MSPRSLTSLGAMATAVLVLGAVACGAESPGAVTDTASGPPPSPLPDGSAGETGDGEAGAPPIDAPTAIDVRTAGTFVRAARRAPHGDLVVVYETPVHLMVGWGEPVREIAWLDAAGHERARRGATPGRELLDVAVHPSGEATILEASRDGYFLVRISAAGAALGETALVDDAILTDPPALKPSESRSRIETITHDTGRVASDGERVFLATRTGRHSVVAYRLTWDGAAFAIESRTLVVPAHSITPTALHGGSYDTFGQLDAHYAVSVAVDDARVGWVGVEHARLESGAMVRAHAAVFGESLATDPDWLDAFVTRVAPSGARLGTSVVSTPDDEQLYGLRAIGTSVYALGRTEHWNAQGTGFDALVAKIDARGEVTVRSFDVDAGDIAFDVAPAANGALIVVGASGYAQNPNGASISEASRAFAVRLDPNGTITRLVVPHGPRHNEARVVVGGPAWGRGSPAPLVIGGMLDGPDTHSADGDASLLRADGFLVAHAL